MRYEHKELRCECGCNLFSIRKMRDTESVLKRTGTRQYYCVDCDSQLPRETTWIEIDFRMKEIISTRWNRMKIRIERLVRNNERQSKWIDSVLENKSLE